MARQITPVPNYNHWKSPTPIFYFGFFYTFSMALVLYFNSTLISELAGPKAVTPIFSIAALITITAYLGFNKIITLYGSFRSAIGFMSINTVALLLIGLYPNQIVIVITSLIAQLVITSLIALNTDIFLESESEDATTGNTRGLFLTFVNVAFFLAPVIGGVLASYYNLQITYLFASFVSFIAGMILILKMNKFKDPKYSSLNTITDLINSFKRVTLAPIFYVQLLLQSFYALMVIYSSLYLHQIVGLPLESIGLIMSTVLIAFILVEWPVGRLLDYRSSTLINSVGIIILGGSLFVLGLTPIQSPMAVWIIILFISRIGAAIVEITSEVTFFKAINATDTNALEVFRMLRPISYLLIPIVAGTVLTFVSYNALFIMMGTIIIITGLYASTKLST